MSLNAKSKVRLVNGGYEYDSSGSISRTGCYLHGVHYGYVTSAKEMDAVVVLGYHTGGTAGRPELVAWFEAGTRADSGLYRVQATTGALIVDL